MNLSSKIEISEEAFTVLLPKDIQAKSKRFFTPAHIAVQAAKWLSGDDKRKVLDIGAGVGKFCFFGACFTKSQFHGIELRPHLVKIANDIFKTIEIENAQVVHGNIIDFKLSDYEAIYMFNPFQENILPFLGMDDTVTLSFDFYGSYTQYTFEQLAKTKKGTRLVTYYGCSFEIPACFKLVEEFKENELKFWIKQ